MLQKIYIVRHGFRSGWTVDPLTGEYTAGIRSPTGIAVDPGLTAHGVVQARELAGHLVGLNVEAVYSSPFYRCLQTMLPFVSQLGQSRHQRGNEGHAGGGAVTVRADYGLSEWFGPAPFTHPGPASAQTLRALFPFITEFVGDRPHARGETLAHLRQRLERTLRSLVERCDEEGVRAVVVCTHAAAVIMLGRILTGVFPADVGADDFGAYTCGLSTYRRNTNGGVLGGWECEGDSECGFLSGGAERGWRFVGEEDFPAYKL